MRGGPFPSNCRKSPPSRISQVDSGPVAGEVSCLAALGTASAEGAVASTIHRRNRPDPTRGSPAPGRRKGNRGGPRFQTPARGVQRRTGSAATATGSPGSARLRAHCLAPPAPARTGPLAPAPTTAATNISDETRFDVAYKAVMQCALVALLGPKAIGRRPTSRGTTRR